MTNKRRKNNPLLGVGLFILLLLIGVVILFTINGMISHLGAIEKESVDKKIAQELTLSKNNFEYVRNETFTITDKRVSNKIVSFPILATRKTGILTVMKGEEFFLLEVPLKTHASSYPGLELTVQIGKDDTYVLSEDGDEVYYKEAKTFENEKE